MRRRFEERVWKRTETFRDYVHEKTILANHLTMVDDEVLSYIIDGIPDVQLRDVARVQGFESSQSLLQAFKEISLRDRNYSTNFNAKSGDRGGVSKRRGDKNASVCVKSELGEKSASDEKNTSGEKGGNVASKRCFNCGYRDHISANCPTKDKGTRCFVCGEHGHVASKCLNKTDATKSSYAVTQTKQNKYDKKISIDGVPIEAILDNGSDITIMRADEYVKLGSPRFQGNSIPFRGRESNVTLGKFQANLTVNGNSYPILIRVISDDLLRHKLLIGRDFLHTIDLTIKRGKATISPPSETFFESNSELPEIFRRDRESRHRIGKYIRHSRRTIRRYHTESH